MPGGCFCAAVMQFVTVNSVWQPALLESCQPVHIACVVVHCLAGVHARWRQLGALGVVCVVSGGLKHPGGAAICQPQGGLLLLQGSNNNWTDGELD